METVQQKNTKSQNIDAEFVNYNATSSDTTEISSPMQIVDSMGATTCDTLECWIQNSLNMIIVIAALVAIVSMVYSGFLYIFSQGKDEKVEKAQKTMAYTIVGLILVFIAPLLIKFVLTNFIGTR